MGHSPKLHLVHFLILAQPYNQKLKNGRIKAIWQQQCEEILMFYFNGSLPILQTSDSAVAFV